MSTHTVDVEPIERLADKVKGLIAILERTRGELERTVEDNLRLSREVEHLKTQLSEAKITGADVSSLLEEREQIRTRVSEMLEQLESISV